MTHEERFLSKIVKPATGCWLWTGKIAPNGYAMFAIRHATHAYAHRWAFEHFRGEIPAGHDLDHLCRRRACVNPEHLQPVTRRENLLRGDTITARHAATTHCPQGHELHSREHLHLSAAAVLPNLSGESSAGVIRAAEVEAIEPAAV